MRNFFPCFTQQIDGERMHPSALPFATLLNDVLAYHSGTPYDVAKVCALENPADIPVLIDSLLEDGDEKTADLLRAIWQQQIPSRLWYMFDENGKPFIGFFLDGGVRVKIREATAGDKLAACSGHFSYDSQRCPSSAAWAKHIREGGD